MERPFFWVHPDASPSISFLFEKSEIIKALQSGPGSFVLRFTPVLRDSREKMRSTVDPLYENRFMLLPFSFIQLYVYMLVSKNQQNWTHPYYFIELISEADLLKN